MSLKIKLGNFLYKNAFSIYRPLYFNFKRRQDKFEIELLKKHIKANDIVLDIGANVGFYAKILSQIVSTSGQVHCFEPDSINFSYLKAECKNLKNTTINNLAVGPVSESIKMYTSKELNVDHRTYKPEVYDKEIKVNAVSIDDYLKNNPKVDFIKMDIQGFEMEALKGMKNILNSNPNIKLITEFWPYGLKRAGTSATFYFEYLTSIGFICYLLEKESLQKLSSEKVKELEKLADNKDYYYNIFASKTHV